MKNNFIPFYKFKKENDYCWIHLTEIKIFLYLGANQYEEKIGQNISIALSLKIKYKNTLDNLENTIDYGSVYEHIIQKIKSMHKVKLLEYLVEQLLNSIGENFKDVAAARISIEKGYVPLKEFTGKVKIEAQKEYKKGRG